MIELMKNYVTIIEVVTLITFMVLIVADTLLGIIISLRDGAFEFQKIASFVCSKILPMIGGYLVMGLVAMVIPEFRALTLLVATAIIATMTSMILEKLRDLGLPVPERLTK